MFQGFTALQISTSLHFSYKTILRDIGHLKDQKTEESLKRNDSVFQEAVDRKRWEYSETVRLFLMEPYQFPVKYQEVETIGGKQVVVNKIKFVEENVRLPKLHCIGMLRQISNDIDKLCGLLSPEFAERFMAMQVDPGKGVIYERPWLSEIQPTTDQDNSKAHVAESAVPERRILNMAYQPT